MGLFDNYLQYYGNPDATTIGSQYRRANAGWLSGGNEQAVRGDTRSLDLTGGASPANATGEASMEGSPAVDASAAAAGTGGSTSSDTGYLGDISQYYKSGKGNPKAGSEDLGATFFAPEREARARYLGLMPRVTHIGESLVGSAAGPASIERSRMMDTFEESQRAGVANQLRKMQATQNVIQQGIGLVKDIVCYIYGGVYCQAAKMASSGGGGGGNLGSLAGMASNYMGGGGGGGGMGSGASATAGVGDMGAGAI